jgi:ribosome-associated translation inhibitor RaiA
MTDSPITELSDDRAPGALVAHASNGSIPIEFSTSGAISAGDRQAVVDAFDKLLDSVDDTVRHIRVRMVHGGDRNRIRPTTIRAVLDLRGGAVRTNVSADTTHTAVAMLETKLHAQLRHRIERRQSLSQRNGVVADGSWRHGALAPERPDFYPRPAEEREIVRHKSVAPGLTSVEEALFDLTMMDYDFYLFTAASSERDALVARELDADGNVVVRAHFVGGPEGLTVHSRPEGVEIDEHPAPELSLDDARERLDVGHEPFVFFVDAGSGRGHVLYRRYDGHYGLIVPIDEDD